MKILTGFFLIFFSHTVHAMSLVEAYNLALMNDPALQSELRYYDISQERVMQSKSLLMPQILLRYSEMKSQYETQFGSNVSEASDAYQIGVSVPIFNLEVWRGVEKAAMNVDLANYSLNQRRQDTAVKVLNIYLDTVYAIALLDEVRKERDSYVLHVKTAREELKKGLINKMDFLESQARLELIEAQVSNAEGRLDLALLQLSNMTQKDVRISSLQKKLLVENPKWKLPKIDVYMENAIAGSLKIAESVHRSKIARQELKISSAKYYPTLELLASYAETTAKEITSYPSYSKFMLSLNYPIYDGGMRSSLTREGYSKIKASEFEIQQAKTEVQTRIQELYVSYQTSKISALAYEKSYRSAIDYLDSAKLANRVGLKSLVEILDAEHNIYRVYSQLVKSRRDMIATYFELKILVGESIEDFLLELTRLDM
jgi:protease secretion system outer membrane protein